MIVKIKSNSPGTGWVMFDEAKNIRYDTASADPRHRSLYDDVFDGEVHFVGLSASEFSEHTTGVSVIEFIREGIEYCVFFNTVAYLCNDQGRTVDKVIPQRHQTPRNGDS